MGNNLLSNFLMSEWKKVAHKFTRWKFWGRTKLHVFFERQKRNCWLSVCFAKCPALSTPSYPHVQSWPFSNWAVHFKNVSPIYVMIFTFYKCKFICFVSYWLYFSVKDVVKKFDAWRSSFHSHLNYKIYSHMIINVWKLRF